MCPISRITAPLSGGTKFPRVQLTVWNLEKQCLNNTHMRCGQLKG